MQTRQELNTEILSGSLTDIPAEIKDGITKFFVKSDYRFFHSVCHSLYDLKADELHEQYLNTHKIATNGNSIFFILKNGQLIAFGDNREGQLGLESKCRSIMSPSAIHLNEEHSAVAMALGTFHSLLLTDKGEVLTCGDNSYGQLGLGDYKARSTFVKVNLNSVLTKDENIVAVEACSFNNLLLTNKGRVLSCGKNVNYSLGLNEKKNYNTFALVELSNVLQNEEIVVVMSSCNNYSLLLTDKGKVLVSGNEYIKQYNKFTLVKLSHVLDKNETIVALSASATHNLLLTNKGQVLTRGNSHWGQLGLGDALSQEEFERIDLSSVLQKNEIIVAVATNTSCYSLLLTDKGRVLVCGENYKDRFGFGNDKHIRLFSEVDLSAILECKESIVAIKSGNNDLLLTNKGRVIAWGKDHFAGNKEDLFTVLDVDFLTPKDELSQSNCMTNS